MAYGTSQAYTSADRYMPPEGFVFSFQGGDYYNPTTGERWSPVTGQRYGETQQPASNTTSTGGTTTPTQSQPSLGQQGLNLGANTLATTGSTYAVSSMMGGSGAAPSMPVVIPALSGEVAGTAGAAGASGAGAAGGAGATGGTGGASAAGGVSAGTAATAAGILAAIMGAIVSSNKVEKMRDRKGELSNKEVGQAWAPEVALGMRDTSFTPEWVNKWDLGFQGLKALSNSSIYGGKGTDQLQRDAVRGALEKTGVLPDDDIWTFNDGTVFDFSQDGGARLPNFGTSELQPSGQRAYYDVDWTDPAAGETVSAINPILYAIMPNDDKLRSDFGGYFYNAVVAGNPVDRSQRIKEIYAKTFGGTGSRDTRDAVASAVWNSFNTGQITPEQRNAALAEIDKQFGVVNPNQGKGGEAEFGRAYIPQNNSPTQSASLQPLSTQPNPTPPLSPSPNVQQTIPQGTTVPDRAKGRLATPAGFNYFGNPAQVAPTIGSRVTPMNTLGRSIGLGTINKIAEQARPAIREQAKVNASTLARAIAGRIGAKK